MRTVQKYLSNNGREFERPESALQQDFIESMQQLGFGEGCSTKLLDMFNEVSQLRDKFIQAVKEIKITENTFQSLKDRHHGDTLDANNCT